jgi:hypothetical protein
MLEIGCRKFENASVCNVVSGQQGDLNHTRESKQTSRKVLRSYQNENVFVHLLLVYRERCLLHGVRLSIHGVVSDEDRDIASKQVEDNHAAIRNCSRWNHMHNVLDNHTSALQFMKPRI